ncbi:MAG: DUF2029 domain-containing protein [Anaerolineales bacterium]|nr:DUF2029 domain-containing protein [Anaerolineales bacterium]
MVAVRKNRSIQGLIILLVGAIIIAGFTWVNYSFSKNNPGGNDFLVLYVGSKSLLMEGKNPYSDEVAIRIQTAANGHPVQGDEHELRVAYPLYSILLFAPFSLINNYTIARAVWMTALELAIISLVFVSLRLMDWEPPLWLKVIILLFTLIWYPSIRGVVNGNAAILTALVIVVTILSIRENRDQAAGVLLAISTIKPQLVILLILYILTWSVYQKRWALIKWFLGTLAILVLVGMIFIPNWILQNLWEILRYTDINPASALARTISKISPGFESTLTWGISFGLGLLMLYEWWNGRNSQFPRFIWVTFLTLVISQWVGIQIDPGNPVIIFPSIIMVLAVWDKRLDKRGSIIVGAALGLLFFGLWILFIFTTGQSNQSIQHPVMLILLPAITLLGLYWIKWWVTAPVRTIWSENP